MGVHFVSISNFYIFLGPSARAVTRVNLVLRHTAEAIAGTLTFRNHWAVANPIGTCTAATGGAGHPRMTKRIVSRFSLILFSSFSHHDHLIFSNLATFQVISAN